jgi:hypothetical protein
MGLPSWLEGAAASQRVGGALARAVHDHGTVNPACTAIAYKVCRYSSSLLLSNTVS